MGIGDKKSVLRNMYQNAAAAEQHPAETAPVRSARLEARFDKVFVGIIHGVLYLLFLLGVCMFAGLLHAQYSAGAAFQPARVTRYIRDGMSMIGGSLALIVLGILIFIWFRNRLPRRTKWIALGCIIALFPGAIISTSFLAKCHEWGRRHAFSQLDTEMLLAGAREIQRTFPLTDMQPREVGATDFATSPLPTYIDDHLHPNRARVYPTGVLLGLDGTGGSEGIILVTGRMSEAQAEKCAKLNEFELISRHPPVFRFKSDDPETKFIEDRGTASTLPRYNHGYPF